MNKFILSSLMAATAAVPALAGVNNVNYQAVIKDANGVVANKEVALKFEILNADAVVYTEEQNVKTDAAGLVVCQLGKEDELATLEWGDLTLRVTYDNKVLSNAPISSVPTALYALRSADSDEIKDAVVELMQDVELNKETILGINAEIVKLNGVADDFAAFEEEYQETFQKQVEVMDGLTTSVNQLMPEVERLVAEAEDNGETLRGMNADLTKLNGSADEFNEFKDETQTTFQALSNTLEEMGDHVSQVTDAVVALQQEGELNKETILGINAEIVRLDGIVVDYPEFKDDTQTTFQGLSNHLEEMGDHLSQVTDAVVALQQESESDKETMMGVNAELVKLNGAVEDFEEFKGEYQESFQKLSENFTEMAAEVDKNIEAVTELENKLDPAGEIQTKLTNVTNVSAANAEAIVELENAVGENGRLTTQITQLQNKTGENAASIDELENAVGENGRLMLLINQLQTRLASLEDAYDDAVGSIDRLEGQVRQLQSKVAALEAK